MVRERKPEWIRVRFPGGERFMEVKRLLREQGLHTVCEEARCPNIGECFNARHGDLHDPRRHLHAQPAASATSRRAGRRGLDLMEPQRLARTVETLGLDHAVITSVEPRRPAGRRRERSSRAASARSGSALDRTCTVEVLIPDFEGDSDALRTVLEARPEVLNHNIGDGAPPVPRASADRRSTRARWSCSARVKEIDPAMTTQVGHHGRPRRDAARRSSRRWPTSRRRLRPAHGRPVPAPVAEAPARSSATGTPTSSPRSPRRAAPRLPAGRGRAARALLVPRGGAAAGGAGGRVTRCRTT